MSTEDHINPINISIPNFFKADDNDTSEGPPCCRVCHSEGENDRPLYHPCRCDGTIKFVHQDCLVEWVRVSRQAEPKCELCGEKFQFKNVYASDAPVQLSFFEFCCGIIPRVAEYGSNFVRLVVLGMAWFAFVPLFTAWWIDICMGLVLRTDIPWMAESMFSSFHSLISYWWNGFVVSAGIIILSFAVTQVFFAVSDELVLLNNAINAERERGATQPTVQDSNTSPATLSNTQHPANQDQVTDIHNNNAPIQNLQEAVTDDPPLAGNEVNLGVDGLVPLANQQEILPEVDQPIERPVEPVQPPPQLPPQVQGQIRPQVQGAQDDHLLNEIDIINGPMQFSLKRCIQLCQFNALVILTVHLIPIYTTRVLLQPLPIYGRFISLCQESFFNILKQYHHLSLNEFNFLQNDHPFHISEAITTAANTITDEYLWVRMHAIMEWCLGMFILSQIAMVTAIGYACFYYDRQIIPAIRLFLAQVSAIWNGAGKFIKVTVLFAMEGCVLPQLLGWLVDIVTLKAFDMTLAERLQICHRNAIPCSVIHWIIGFLFMLHIGVIALELRELIRKELLVGILPESPTVADLDESIFDTLGSKSVIELSRRFLLNTCFYVPGVLFSIMIPVRCGHYIFPLSKPLQLDFKEILLDIQIPLELLIFHVLVPFVLERMRHRVVIRSLLRWFLINACNLLKLTDFLINPQALEVQEEFGVWGEGVGGVAGVDDLNRILFRDRVAAMAAARAAGAVGVAPAGGGIGVEQVEPIVPDPVPDVDDLGTEFVADRGAALHERGLVTGDSEGKVEEEEDKSGSGEEEEEDEGGVPLDMTDVDSVPEEEEEVNEKEDELDADSDADIGELLSQLRRRGSARTAQSNGQNHDITQGSRPGASSLTPPNLETCTIQQQETIVVNGDDTRAARAGQQADVANLAIRCLLLLLMGLAAVAIGSSLALHIPLTLGSYVMGLSGLPLDHDLYNLSIGVTLIWGSSLIVRYVLKDLPGNASYQIFIRVICKWGMVVVKVALLSTIWLAVTPLLVGLLFEAVVVAPLRAPLCESPSYPIVQCWALGLVFLKIWMRCVMLGAFGENEWRRRFDRVFTQGISNVDVMFIVTKIFLPMYTTLLDYLVTPYFLARTIPMIISMDSYSNQTLLVRYSFIIHILLRLFLWGSRKAWKFLTKLHNEIRDSRYLLGTELTNRGNIRS